MAEAVYGTEGSKSPFTKYPEREAEKIQKIEVLIKALGTMVIEPDIVSDPNNVGQQINRGPVQKPILQGSNREIAVNQLVSFIKSLE